MLLANKRNQSLLYYRGRVALYAFLKALGVEKGDEVIVQGFTCLAVPSPICSLGATPIYVDVDARNLSMNSEKLEEKISERTKAIVLQHTFGIPGNIGAITEIANRRAIPVIEDCCHAIGASYDGIELGAFGKGAFYSFEWGKPIIAGVGGNAIVNDQQLFSKMLDQYDEFVSPSTRESVIVDLQYMAYKTIFRPAFYWKIKDIYQYLSKSKIIVGSFQEEEFEGKLSPDYNKRMLPSTQSRLAKYIKKYENEDNWIGHERAVTYYTDIFESLGCKLPVLDARAKPNYMRYPFSVRSKNKVLTKARHRGIELSGIFLTPIHPLSGKNLLLLGYEEGCCPVAEHLSNTIVSLPVHKRVSKTELEKVAVFLRHLREEGELHDQVLPDIP